MKRFKYIVLVLICMFFLSGCVKEHTTIGIKSDKSMTYENEILFSNELGDDMTSMLGTDEYEKEGYKVTVVTTDGYKGVKVTKKFKNIDDYSNNKGEEVKISDFLEKDFNKSVMFKKESGFFKDTYTAKFKYLVNTTDYEDMETLTTDEEEITLTPDNDGNTNDTEEEETDNLDNLDMQNYLNLMAEMEFTFNVNLPYKAISSNASDTSENGKSLKWNLGVDNEKDIEFEFSILNITHIAMLGGGALLLIIILIVVIVALKRKKASKETLIHKDYDPSVEGLVNGEKDPIKVYNNPNDEIPVIPPEPVQTIEPQDNNQNVQ